MLKKSLKEALLISTILVEKRMEQLLPQNFHGSQLVAAMRYSALSGGKRIRPFLLMATAEMLGTPATTCVNAAAAIEFIHSYSLIHDDLPAMDDDDFRREQPSCHKKFDEATAILAGDALLTLAFEILSNPDTHKEAHICCELINVLAKSSGFRGMVGGQMIDLETSHTKLSKEQIANMHRQKTGELFMASSEMGAILGRAGKESRMSLRYFAHDLGLAFQIRDDILDHQGNNELKVEIDEQAHKKLKENASIVDVVGLEAAHQQLDLLCEQAIAHLQNFGVK
ncbi:MAG TPA: farnesyl diphosphate synthase, partial [Rickettsiales bacterium]|nr:farnesyl diphosphate synthase [Rickettsiales bacterium]